MSKAVSVSEVRLSGNATKQEFSFSNAQRTQESIMAPLERRCLRFFAGRLPAWVNSDHLTLLGFVGFLLAGAGYALAAKWPAALFLVNFFIFLNWFGDSLDGTLARYRNKLRPRYGFYVDHVVDILGATAVMAGLAFSGYITPMIALVFLVGFLLFSAETYLASYTIGNFKLSYFKFSPTEMRLLIIVGNFFAYRKPMVGFLGRKYLLFDVGFTIGAIVMAFILILSAVKNTRRLYREEKV